MKRIQSQTMAEFLIQMIAQTQCNSLTGIDDSKPPIVISPPEQILQMEYLLHERPTSAAVRQFLNANGGVWDVAGGSGHISAALSVRGIRCTVIDPRATAGQLPRRDRKAYAKDVHQALLRAQQTCLPILEPAATDDDDLSPRPTSSPCIPLFDTVRAWLGNRPEGVDETFRNIDQAPLPVLNAAECSAMVALHPDEATDAIVDLAVRYQVPFCIVPCCVFGRLFPDRRTIGGTPVSTLSDLLDYLQAKHPSIQRATLSFPGANTILWSTFGQECDTGEG